MLITFLEMMENHAFELFDLQFSLSIRRHLHFDVNFIQKCIVWKPRKPKNVKTND